MRNRSGRLAAMVLGGLLAATTAMAQNSFPTPPPTSYDDYFRTLTRDAFQMVQQEVGTQRWKLDQAATKKGVGGMTAIESVKISVSASTPAEWDAAVRKQLPTKVKALVSKLSTATVIGNPTSAASHPDTVTIIDQLRGVILQAKHGEPGITGKRSVTLAVLVGR